MTAGAIPPGRCRLVPHVPGPGRRAMRWVMEEHRPRHPLSRRPGCSQSSAELVHGQDLLTPVITQIKAEAFINLLKSSAES